MGNCCAGTNEAPEINDDKNINRPTDKGEPRSKETNLQKENVAAIAIQAHFKGIMARRAIKAQYGFETNVGSINRGEPKQYTQSDNEIAAARHLVM